MDDERDRRMEADVVDATDAPMERERPVERRSTEERLPASTTREEHELAPLFNEQTAENFRTRWLAIQSKFVDDPRDSVKQADDLVADVIESITASFADRRGSMEKQWSSGETSTEELRIALKQYRSFFDRLLTLQS